MFGFGCCGPQQVSQIEASVGVCGTKGTFVGIYVKMSLGADREHSLAATKRREQQTHGRQNSTELREGTHRTGVSFEARSVITKRNRGSASDACCCPGLILETQNDFKTRTRIHKHTHTVTPCLVLGTLTTVLKLTSLRLASPEMSVLLAFPRMVFSFRYLPEKPPIHDTHRPEIKATVRGRVAGVATERHTVLPLLSLARSF